MKLLLLSRSFSQVNLSVGARNIFDTYPSRMKDTDNNNNYTFPWAVTSPSGRRPDDYQPSTISARV